MANTERVRTTKKPSLMFPGDQQSEEAKKQVELAASMDDVG